MLVNVPQPKPFYGTIGRAWGRLTRRLGGFYSRPLYAAAWLWRRSLVRTRFIAVSGSLGKTTTKELIAAALSRDCRVMKTRGSLNYGRSFSREILRVKPWHRFAVVELGIERPGDMDPLGRLLKPDVAVVLGVARCHMQGFGTVAAVAAEKAKLLSYMAPGGVAVLNAADRRVVAMASRARGEVRWFGNADSSDCRASEVRSRWPERLEFTLTCGETSRRLRTRFVGAHWTSGILAAVATARACGVDPMVAAEAIGKVEPFYGRMQPALLPSGAVMIRDDRNGSIDSLLPALEALESARAKRRIVVLSQFTDTKMKPRDRVKFLGREAARIADLAVFVGERAGYAARAAQNAGMAPETIFDFTGLREVASFLKAELRAGDLVLLKASATEHLTRIYYAQLGSVACWKADCRKTMICDECSELGARPDPPTEAACYSW